MALEAVGQKMADLFARLEERRLIVVGDIIVDEYNTGEALGISAETPTIVARQLNTRRSLGGAALMVRNVLALGGHAAFVSICGDDSSRDEVQAMAHPRLEKLVMTVADRSTTMKRRFWVDGYKLLQWDHLDHSPLSEAVIDRLRSQICARLPEYDALIVSDYRHGLLTPAFAGALVKEARRAGKPVYIDSQVSQRSANHTWYAGATLFCLNEKEARGIDSGFCADDLPGSLARLRTALDAETVVLKRGAEGCCALIGNGYTAVPAASVQAIDTTGAGDAFFAALSLAPLPVGADSLLVANLWAGLSTARRGAEPPAREELSKYLEGKD